MEMAPERRRECSMCGDPGFQDWLFQCTKCLSRFQHRCWYCSKAYYEIGGEECSVCDWCFVDEQRDLNSKNSGNNLRNSDPASSKRQKRLSAHQTHQNNVNGGWKPSGGKMRRRYRALHEILC